MVKFVIWFLPQLNKKGRDAQGFPRPRWALRKVAVGSPRGSLPRELPAGGTRKQEEASAYCFWERGLSRVVADHPEKEHPLEGIDTYRLPSRGVTVEPQTGVTLGPRHACPMWYPLVDNCWPRAPHWVGYYFLRLPPQSGASPSNPVSSSFYSHCSALVTRCLLPRGSKQSQVQNFRTGLPKSCQAPRVERVSLSGMCVCMYVIGIG